MRILVWLLLPLLVWAKPFNVATYNVQNLFDDINQGTEYKEYTSGKHNWNSRTVQVKLNHIAEVICDMNVEIIGLQEIENYMILTRLQETLKRVGCDYKYSAITSKKGAPIQVALLSKYAIKQSREIKVSYSPKVRNILEVDLAVQGHTLKVFVNHWKSKAFKGVESKRIVYAKKLFTRINKLSPSQEYIILGDFNSDYNANLTLEKKLNDTNGKTGFYDILQVNRLEHEMMSAKRTQHMSLWHELTPENRWSHTFYGKKSSLDHIVVPQKMFDQKGIDYVNDSFHVFKLRYLFTKRGYINRWRYKNAKHLAKGYSDHLPLIATFDIKPYVPTDSYIRPKQVTKNIEYLYDKERLNDEVILKDVTVIFKRRNNAVIKQSKKGRGIYLFWCAGNLKEGYTYDLLVTSIKSYHGLKEVTTAYVLKEKSKKNVDMYIHAQDYLVHTNVKQNEIVKNVSGTYRDKMLFIKGKKYSLYFKNKKLKPKNGVKLKIAYAHLGYYKGMQLVIHSKKDFKILEN